MTQSQHDMIAIIILFAITQYIWHKYIKNHPATLKNRKEWLRRMW